MWDVLQQIYEQNGKNVTKTKKVMDEMYGAPAKKELPEIFQIANKRMKASEEEQKYSNLQKRLSEAYPSLDSDVIFTVTEEISDFIEACKALDGIQADLLDYTQYQQELARLDEYQAMRLTEIELNALVRELSREGDDNPEAEPRMSRHTLQAKDSELNSYFIKGLKNHY